MNRRTLGRTTGAVLVGIDARLIEIEVDLPGGVPTIAAVGLPDTAVREGIDRIRSALRHGGFTLPEGKIVVNLAPAEVRKQGTTLDLPIAVALLVADGRMPPFGSGTLLVGELGLDGGVRPVRGALSIALASQAAGHDTLLVPRANLEEARLVTGLAVEGVGSLADVAAYARGERGAPAALDPRERLAEAAAASLAPDLADVQGQAAARRALEIAAAGGHHLLMSGPPGSGKTMLARRLPGILPPLELGEALAVTRVWSAAGLAQGLVVQRPFRAPHHAVSFAGLTGGGPRLRPGEISLASGGVLFLDELTEFRRDALEALRQPLEDGEITVARVRGAATFPARFTLVASMNPCPCGYLGHPDGRCSCTEPEIRRYRGKLSGPLLDRFDLTVDVPAVDLRALGLRRAGESSADVRERVVAARVRQRRRFAADPGAMAPSSNGQMGPEELRRHAGLAGEAQRMLLAACDQLGLSARGYDRVRRVARTIADLRGAAGVGAAEIAEALQYRRVLWRGRD